MSDIVISAENVGKSYLIRHERTGVGYRRLSEEIAEAVARPLRRFRQRGNGSPAPQQPPTKERFWALKGVSFTVQKGEAVGIIGRNGAGKSTLLKVLSRITEPAEGRVRIRGRVASLLEVGTGFHPELTGRENIFLNGTILGMARREIRKKFDEIVAFAEIEKFLDTPVKRYSSGMYVRLAFAVAAHIEPEILIVDEVLAVGDVQFQKKCLGKMKDVAGEGRTVLFVSHNMAAIEALTSRCVFLDGGRVVADGLSKETVKVYLGHAGSAAGNESVVKRKGRGRHSAIKKLGFAPDGASHLVYEPGSPVTVDIRIETDGHPNLSIDIFLKTHLDQKLILYSTNQIHGIRFPDRAGVYDCRVKLDGLWLASGQYKLDVSLADTNVAHEDLIEDALVLDVPLCSPFGTVWDFKGSFGYGNIVWMPLGPPTFQLLP